MLVDINWLQMVSARKREINDTPLDKVRWIRDGVELKLNAIFMRHYKFMGLNITDLADWDGEVDLNGEKINLWEPVDDADENKK